MELNLKANTRNEELVLEHLKKTATEVLTEKINAGNKTLAGCWNFIVNEARKRAVKQCACIEDAEVFGWALHYFEEDSISECKSAPASKVSAATDKPAKKAVASTPKKSAESSSSEQMSIFDF